MPSVQLELKFVTQLLALIWYKCWHVVYVCIIFLTSFLWEHCPQAWDFRPQLLIMRIQFLFHSLSSQQLKQRFSFLPLKYGDLFAVLDAAKVCYIIFFLIKIMIGPWGNFLNTIYRMLLIDMVSLEPWGEWCGDTLLHVANKVLIVELIDNCNQTYFQHIFWEFAIWMMQESVYSETLNVAMPIVDISWFYS